MDRVLWRRGEMNPVSAAVNAETVIEIGDLLWLTSNNAKSAGVAATLEQFKKYFLGVALQRSIKGDQSPIRVATTGIFEFDCDLHAWELGTLVRPSIRNGQLANQHISATYGNEFAIGRVAKFQHNPHLYPNVLVAIHSTIMIGHL